jgi:hypothetical protein
VLERVLCEYDDGASDSSEAPEVRTQRGVLEQLGTTDSRVAERLAGAFYFHATRVLDQDSFRRRGIRPLGDMMEDIWATLRLLVPEFDHQEWSSFRARVESAVGLYRFKTGSPAYHGPHGDAGNDTLHGEDVEAACLVDVVGGEHVVNRVDLHQAS